MNDMPGKPITITDATFTKSIKKYSVVVIDCWAPWCTPCKLVAPVIEELAKEYCGKVVFGKLNVDENERTALKYSIMSIPTFLIFKSSKLVDTVVGALPKKTLKSIINKYL
jgi:thioredoxin 1